MVAGSDTAVTARVTPALRRVTNGLGAAWGGILRRLPTRFHAITDEIAKFGTIGVINLVVNFAVFNALLVAIHGAEVKAKAVATIVATTCAYFLNRYWTYRNRPKTTLRREYSLFFFFNAIGLVIETSFVAAAKYGFNETNLLLLNVFSFFGIAVGTVFRFWAYRTHVFKKDEAVAAAQPAETAASASAVRELPVIDGLVHVEDNLQPEDNLQEEDYLQGEMVQLELDDMITHGRVVTDGADPTGR
jgi:putative flippase GtrA